MKIPDIPKSTMDLVTSFPSEYTSKIIKIALAALQPVPQDLEKPLNKLAMDKNISKDEVLEVISVYVTILKLLVHSQNKSFYNTLLEMGFAEEFVENLPFIKNEKELTETYFTPHYEYFQNVSGIQWRIDISFLNSSIGNKTLPNVILSIKHKTGKSFTIELNSKAFNKLRFNIALILKHTKSMRNRPFFNKMIK